MTTPLNPHTLPDNDNVPGNHYAYCVRLDGRLFMQVMHAGRVTHPDINGGSLEGG